MSAIRKNLVHAVINRAFDLNDYNDIPKYFEIIRQTVLADESLTKEEKIEAVKIINKTYDREKLLRNEGEIRICEDCNHECLATTYCELCVLEWSK